MHIGKQMPFPANTMEQAEPFHRVVLADDHQRVLESARRLLGPEFQIVAEVNDGLMALESTRELKPDLVLMDIEMPKMDGIRAAEAMRRFGSKARIVFLTVHEEEDYIAAARRLGDGYVLKSRMASDLLQAIEDAFGGRFFLSHRNR
jgi:DNA-binding NarL/FixJ family response regulator